MVLGVADRLIAVTLVIDAVRQAAQALRTGAKATVVQVALAAARDSIRRIQASSSTTAQRIQVWAGQSQRVGEITTPIGDRRTDQPAGLKRRH
ncbi:MAG: hypothetical protein K6U87_08030 [Firmicutes bacterium]|nr:hypothetical protein [Bacillota bacterium]